LQEKRIQTELSLAFMDNGISTTTLSPQHFQLIATDSFYRKNIPLILILQDTFMDSETLTQVRYKDIHHRIE
jgi:hypothetical protein